MYVLVISQGYEATLAGETDYPPQFKIVQLFTQQSASER